MASVNKVILVGRLGKDPELSYLPSGQSVAKFSIATDRQWKDKSGELKKETDWHNIVAWGKTGEVCAKYLSKGKQVYIEGRIQNRTWEKDGQKKYATDIVADNVVFLGGRDEGGGGARDTAPARQADVSPQSDWDDSDDIPFIWAVLFGFAAQFAAWSQHLSIWT